MFENIETKVKSTACGIINLVDCVTLGVMCIYFLNFHNWFWLELTMTILCTIAYLVCIMLVPESAKWHLIRGEKDLALRSFDYIAKFNKVQELIPRDAFFVETVIAQNLNFSNSQVAI